MIHDKFKYDGYDNEFTLCEMGFGDVAFSCSEKDKEDFVTLYFRNEKPRKIGSVHEHKLTHDEFIDGIKLAFVFHNTQTIDALIIELENAKKQLETT